MCKHKTYIPLHGHSTYSIGDGVTKIEDIINKVKLIGADACALTEHGNMSSFLKFYKHAKINNIKPIIGCELYHNDLFYNDKEKFLSLKRKKIDDKNENENEDEEITVYNEKNSHFLAYALNYEGLKNIIHLSNIGFENFYRKPIINTDLIFEKLNEKDNVITTGCLNSEFNKMILLNKENEIIDKLKKYKDKFDKNFYLEIQINGLDEQNFVNEFYFKNYKKLELKPIFALDYHYANKDDWYIQYLLYLIKQRNTVNSMTVDDWFYGVRNLYIKEIDEIYKLAEINKLDKDFLEYAIDSTFELRDKTNIEIPLYENNFPEFISKENLNNVEIFNEKISNNFLEKLKNGLIPIEKKEEYIDRLLYEKKIIIEKKFVDYFLILDDLLNNFVYKMGGNTGAGRGSCGGCLILFILGITKIDPIKWNLIFERFINPERIDPPDVDLDFDSKTHRKVESYLKEKYGQEKVCHIANFSKFKAKSLVKDICRIFELDYNLSNVLTNFFSRESDSSVTEELEFVKNNIKKLGGGYNHLLKFIDDNYDKFLLGDKMLNMIRQVGRHASGILISNKNLNESNLPILRLKGELLTGIQEGRDDREVSELGYLKLDILGLTNASIINETIKLIENKYEIKNLENTLIKSNFDDKNVWNEFKLGKCEDIFQFGSEGMIKLIVEIKPDNIYELCAINSLYRPAALEAGMVQEYIYNRNNPENAKVKLNSIYFGLWDILKETFGAICYQEQVTFILHKVANFTLAESESLRKLLKTYYSGSKEGQGEKFMNIMKRFREGALKNGVSNENIQILLDILGKYTGYSFNKSHSFAYSINAYISMYLKYYYPKEYFSTLLNHVDNLELYKFIKLSKNYGIKYSDFVYGKAKKYFSIDYKNESIEIGLNCIKGIQEKDIDKVLNAKIENIYDLLTFVREQKLGKKAIESLCRLQYFSNIFQNSKELENLMFAVKKKSLKLDELIENAKANNEDYTIKEKLQFQKEYLNFYIFEHPIFSLKKIIDENFNKHYDNIIDVTKVKEKDFGEYYIYGITNKIFIKKTKNGKEYYQLVLEDEINSINIEVWNFEFIKNVSSGNQIVAHVEKKSFGFSLKTNVVIV